MCFKSDEKLLKSFSVFVNGSEGSVGIVTGLIISISDTDTFGSYLDSSFYKFHGVGDITGSGPN